MDAEFQKYLENFNEIVKQNEEQKFKLKKYFFYCVMIILFLVIIFPYILVFVFHEKVTKCCRKAPCFSNGDIRQLLFC